MPSDIAKLALDTNLLAYGSSRRLLHGVALEAGISLAVLPEVHAETLRRIGAIEERRWNVRLENDSRYSNYEKQRIVDATSTGARAWFEEDLLGGNSNFVRLHEDFDIAWESRRLARSLPEDSIRDHDGLATGDALIIGQAIAFRVDLLSTNNFNTIRHDIINEWVSTQGRNKQLLYMPDETLNSLAGYEKKKCYEWTIAYGPWQVELEDELTSREAFEGALQRIEGAGFAETARRAQWDYEKDDCFITRVRELSRSHHAQGALETERRLASRVLAHATDAGWSR